MRRELGRGGMGVVYLARDARLQREVAIKAVAPELAQDQDRLARFKREARLIAQLNHPHIAQVYHLLEHEDQTYLILEYVPGRSLGEMIDREGPLDPELALDLCAQVARAMEAAHTRGIVHRDLKPANVRVTEEGQSRRIIPPTLPASRPGTDPPSAGASWWERPATWHRNRYEANGSMPAPTSSPSAASSLNA
ncbi:MAG: serine/threonine-protein kinase [Planctomycetota bacterium]